MKIVISKNSRGAFSLLEVMIAIAVFFVAVFAILALVSQSLDNARRLQRPTIDAGLLAAQLSLTNSLVEGTESGDLGDLLGDAYKGYTWTREIVEAQSNKLFQVNFAIQHNGGDKPVVSQTSVLFYRPQSPAGSLEGATVR
jgi:type II secretion system protein I